MNKQLENSIYQLFHAYKSPNQMLKGNTMILKTLQYDKFPELARAFCMGAVFAQMARLLDAFYQPKAPEYEALKEAHEMFLAFARGEFEYL